eukprot:m.131130 g.131130  ORF g.131130 m.131130 type:complete len:529 (+) comp15901_c0_seq3:314-1900(+)
MCLTALLYRTSQRGWGILVPFTALNLFLPLPSLNTSIKLLSINNLKALTTSALPSILSTKHTTTLLFTTFSSHLTSLFSCYSYEAHFMCTEEEARRCFDKIMPVSHGEKLQLVDNLEAEAVPSGYALGSCNWLLRDGMTTTCYLSRSAKKGRRHPMPWARSACAAADVLIVNNISTHGYAPSEGMNKLLDAISTTILQDGCVLLPLHLNGLVFDLVEVILLHLNQAGQDPPIYVIGPHAKAAFAFANIYSNWLEKAKRNRVYEPHWPFNHEDLEKEEKLRMFSSASDPALADCFRKPCIVITEDVTLRSGDIVHFVQLFKDSPLNTLIATDPDFDIRAMLRPYQPVAMTVLQVVIDPRLDGKTCHSFLTDSRAHHIFTPLALDHHLHQAPPTLKNKVTTLVKGHSYKIPLHSSTISAELQSSLYKPDQATYAVEGQLNLHNHEYLVSGDAGNVAGLAQAPDINVLMSVLASYGIYDAVYSRESLGHVVTVGGIRIELTPKETTFRLPDADQVDQDMLNMLQTCVQLSS